jgi:pimeloyl-ACP methyl ester carboxylesterase
VKPLLRKGLKGLASAIAVLAVLLGVLALVPAWTPGLGGPDPIAKLESVRLGGVEQWLLIRGADRSKPVLLYLHGGPGSAMISVARQFSTRLEEHFVVVHWDQRGAGKSCSGRVPPASLNLEQILADTHELALWLRERFGQTRIYLLGHSWGSILGVLTVKRHPDLFHAYVGLGQVVDLLRNEEVSLRFVLERALEEGNEEALSELAALRPPYPDLESLMTQRRWLRHYHGDQLEGGAIAEFAKGLLLAPEYTLREELGFVGCVFDSLEHIWHEIQRIDLLELAPRLAVPVYFFTGRHDYNTPFELAEEYFEVLEAPHKEIVWFERSAHMACMEEPERFQDELIRVLAETAAASRGASAPHDR